MSGGRVRTLLAVTFAGALGCSAGSPGGGLHSNGQGGGTNSGGTGSRGAPTSGGTAGHASGAGSGSGAGAGLNAGAGMSGGTASGAGAGPASGGATSLGGSAGSGVAGANGGAAASTPCSSRPGLLFCDDFESAASGALPGAPWSAGLNGDGTVSVDSTVPAHSGTKSVHVHGSGYQTLLAYHDAAILPQASGKFFFRAFVRFDQAMTGGHNTFVIADTFAAPGAGNTTRVGEMNGMLMMTVGGDAHGYLSNQNYYNDLLPGVQFPAQAYACLEMLFDAPHTEIDVWVNGTEVPDLHVTNLAHENYDALHFGFEKYAGPIADIWYDDIAIGTQPIGCN